MRSQKIDAGRDEKQGILFSLISVRNLYVCSNNRENGYSVLSLSCP